MELNPVPERILIIDDVEEIRRVLLLALTAEGYQVKTAGRGAEAREEIDRTGEDQAYHLALVDIMLPDTSGVDLAEHIRQRSPQTEIIFMTGHASVETAAEAVRLGAFAYLSKPVRMGELYQVVRQALEKQKLTAENRRLLAELRESNQRLEDLNRTLEVRVRERTGELLQSRSEVERRAKELETINEITNAVASSLNLKDILGQVVRETRKLIDFDRASVSLAWGSETINEVYFLEPAKDRDTDTGQTYPIKGTGIEWVIKNRQALIRDNLDRKDEYLEDEFIHRTGAKSGIVVPLIRRGEAIGTLNLGSMKSGTYNRSHEKTLRRIAGQIAVAIDNANLYRKLESYSKNLESEVERRTASLEQSLRELREAQEQLVQSEKLAATAKLIAGVAHEIKNPLNSMSLSTANIEKICRTAGDLGQVRELTRESVSILRSDIARLKEMVDRFMSFARPRILPREEADLNSLAREALLSLQAEMDAKGIELHEEYDKDLPPVELEKDEFHRSILNLLLNALEAVEPGGKIGIRTRGDPDGLIIEVSDNGPGIPAEIRDRIFDIFFTTKDRGSGLGLSQVYRAVESHRGSLTFESPEEGNTVFRIRIPRGRAR